MRMEIPFSGTPYQFAASIQQFIGDYYDSDEWTAWQFDVTTPGGRFQPDIPEVTLQISNPNYHPPHLKQATSIADCVAVTALKTPIGTLLFVDVYDQDWPKLKEGWELLEAYLVRQGWVQKRENSQTTEGEETEAAVPPEDGAGKEKSPGSEASADDHQGARDDLAMETGVHVEDSDVSGQIAAGERITQISDIRDSKVIIDQRNIIIQRAIEEKPMSAANAKFDETELASLRRQWAEEKVNLLIIEERLSEFVLETERPLTLIKEKRKKQKVIEGLEQRIEELKQSTSGELKDTINTKDEELVNHLVGKMESVSRILDEAGRHNAGKSNLLLEAMQIAMKEEDEQELWIKGMLVAEEDMWREERAREEYEHPGRSGPILEAEDVREARLRAMIEAGAELRKMVKETPSASEHIGDRMVMAKGRKD